MFGVPGFQVGVLRQLQRFNGVGGRPWSVWNWTASSPRRTLMCCRRIDQRWFSWGSTPTISRIGRLPGSVPDRMANDTPRASWRWRSRAVL
jgi:hypothetical protein